MLVIQCTVTCDGRKMISPPHLIPVNNKIKRKERDVAMWSLLLCVPLMVPVSGAIGTLVEENSTSTSEMKRASGLQH